jgi:hypothetical protein
LHVRGQHFRTNESEADFREQCRAAACHVRLAACSLVFGGAFLRRGSSSGVARRRTPAAAIAVRGLVGRVVGTTALPSANNIVSREYLLGLDAEGLRRGLLVVGVLVRVVRVAQRRAPGVGGRVKA